MIRKLNPIIIVNGIFLIVMMLLFGRFVNTSQLFSKPTDLEILESQLMGHFFTPDSIYELTSFSRKLDKANGEKSAMLTFSSAPPLVSPWGNGWSLLLSNFGSDEWLAERFDSTGHVRQKGCELVFRKQGVGFIGETLGSECGLDSAGNLITPHLRSAPDSLIFATHRKNPDGRVISGQQWLFLRRLTDHN